MEIILTRKAAFKLAWALFWMATSTTHVGLTIKNTTVEMVGEGLIKKNIP